MFSFSELIPKLFPKFSDFDLLRDVSMKYYDAIKVWFGLNLIILFIEMYILPYNSFYNWKAIVDDQYKTYDRNHERHFLDMYFKKIEDTKNDPKSEYTCKFSSYLITVNTCLKLKN